MQPVLAARGEAINDEKVSVRLGAVSALYRIGADAKDAVPAVIQALQDEDVRVRVGAANCLYRMGTAAKDAVPALIDAARDEDVRIRAASALSKIGPCAVPVLNRRQKHVLLPQFAVISRV